MERILKICDEIISTVPCVCIVVFIFFFLSIKRCFAKEGEKRFSLVVLTALTNPAACFWLSLLLSGLVGLVYTNLSGVDYDVGFNIHEVGPALITAGSGALMYLAIILLCARLVAKRFAPRLKSAVTFVFLMYNTVFLNHTILLLKVDKPASGFFVMTRRRPAGLLAASQGTSTQSWRKRLRRIVCF